LKTGQAASPSGTPPGRAIALAAMLAPGNARRAPRRCVALLLLDVAKTPKMEYFASERRTKLVISTGTANAFSLFWLGVKRMGKFKLRRKNQVRSILPRLKYPASRLGSETGQSSVEFAMVSLLFFFLLFAIMDYGWLMFSQMNVQQAVDDGGRYASTGQESGGSGTRITSIISAIQNEISVPSVNASNLSICSVPPGGTTASCYDSTNPSGTAGAAGGPGFTVTIKLVSTLPVMTPLLSYFFPGGYTFTSSSTFQNEPFDPSQTK
jgi:Flp pilus assembly protein TadG